MAQFAASNYLDYTLTDVFAALGSLAATLLFLQVWRPPADPQFTIAHLPVEPAPGSRAVPAWQGWMPWLIVTATVIVWTYAKIAVIGQKAIHWPGLDNAVSITLYDDKAYAAVWSFQPFGTGTAILAAAVITALLVRISPAEFFRCAVRTIRQIWQAVLTVMLIVALAYVMNYSVSPTPWDWPWPRPAMPSCCSRPSSDGWRYSCPEATPPAMPCSATCRWSPPGNCT